MVMTLKEPYTLHKFPCVAAVSECTWKNVIFTDLQLQGHEPELTMKNILKPTIKW